MSEQTTDDGITVAEIENAYEVLEVVRENLQEDGMESMSETVNEAHYLVQMYDEGANWSHDYDLPEVGDRLVDPESNPKYGSGYVEVAEVTDQPAKTYYVETETGKKSVAYLNRSHPEDAPVVKARYVEGSDKLYSFPVTRLMEPWY